LTNRTNVRLVLTAASVVILPACGTFMTAPASRGAPCEPAALLVCERFAYIERCSCASRRALRSSLAQLGGPHWPGAR